MSELNRLRAAIVAEIRWHSIEAVRCRQASKEAQAADLGEEDWLNAEAAERHTEAASRLHAILYPPEEETKP